MPKDDVVVRFINIETGFEWENAAISLIITESAAIYTADTQADPSRCAVQFVHQCRRSSTTGGLGTSEGIGTDSPIIA